MSDRTALTDIVPSVRQEPQHNQSISSRRSRYFLATSVTKKLDHNAQTHTSPERRSIVFDTSNYPPFVNTTDFYRYAANPVRCVRE